VPVRLGATGNPVAGGEWEPGLPVGLSPLDLGAARGRRLCLPNGPRRCWLITVGERTDLQSHSIAVARRSRQNRQAMNELELNHRAEARHDGPPDGALLITRQSIERSVPRDHGRLTPVEPVVEAVQPTLTWLQDGPRDGVPWLWRICRSQTDFLSR
jgi:hypothetical protein